MDDVLFTRRTRNLNSRGTEICTRIVGRRLKRDIKIQFNYKILKFVITNHKSSDSHLSRGKYFFVCFFGEVWRKRKKPDKFRSEVVLSVKRRRKMRRWMECDYLIKKRAKKNATCSTNFFIASINFSRFIFPSLSRYQNLSPMIILNCLLICKPRLMVLSEGLDTHSVLVFRDLLGIFKIKVND